jgi:hypothetical protein
MTGADKGAIDPRAAGTQLRPGLWQTINERHPGSMVEKANFVPPQKFGSLFSRPA